MKWGINGWQSTINATPNHCAVAVYRSSPSGQDLRVDGVSVGSGPASCTNSAGSAIFDLGSNGDVPGSYYNGDILKVLVFNRVLSNAEVQALEACLIDPGDPAPPTPMPVLTVPTQPPVYTQPTKTQTPTATPTSTITETATPSPSFSVSPTSTATPTVTQTATPSATPSDSPTATATPTASPTATASVSPTATRSSTPVYSPTMTPAVECPAEIQDVKVWPNPVLGHCQRHVSVKLGCSADKVEVDVYSPSGCKVKHQECRRTLAQREEWVHLPLDTEDSDLGAGSYFVKVTATKGDTKAHDSCRMMVLK
jgi:hypothetical protein